MYVSIKDEGEACQAAPKASFIKENQHAHPQGHNSCSGASIRVWHEHAHTCAYIHTYSLTPRLVLTEALQITAGRSLYWPACSPDKVLALERFAFGQPDRGNTANSCLVSSPGFNRESKWIKPFGLSVSATGLWGKSRLHTPSCYRYPQFEKMLSMLVLGTWWTEPQWKVTCCLRGAQGDSYEDGASFWGKENVLKLTVVRWLHISVNMLKTTEYFMFYMIFKLYNLWIIWYVNYISKTIFLN